MIIKEVKVRKKNGELFKINKIVTENITIGTIIRDFLTHNPECKGKTIEVIIEFYPGTKYFDEIKLD